MFHRQSISDPNQEYLLGINYMHGRNGVEKNEQMGAAYYQSAAHKGHAKACLNLGMLYEEGRILPKNLKKASQLYRHAHELKETKGLQKLQSLARGFWGFFGNRYAKYHLAIILENSSRPNISNDELLELLRHNPDDRQRIYQRHWLSDIEFFDLQHRALNQQYLPLIDHQLLYSLGLEYLEDPKKQDIKEAERLFKEATAAGNLHASYKLCRAEYFYRLGLKSLNQNDQKKAASQFRQAAAFSSYAAYQRLKRMAEGPFWGLFGGGNPYAQYHLAVLEQSPRLSTIPSHIREECIRDSMDDLRIAGGLGTADSTTYQPMKLLYTTPKAAPLEIKQSDITSAPVTYTTTAPVERTLKEKFLGVFRKKQTPAASIAKLGLHAAKTPDVSLSSPPKPSKNRRVQMTTSSS